MFYLPRITLLILCSRVDKHEIEKIIQVNDLIFIQNNAVLKTENINNNYKSA
jgi:hypothetical protein